jgi:hypothetical protein
MARPSLPTHPRNTWSPLFWKTPSTYLQTLSCRSGRVVAGGEDIYLLRPGQQSLHVIPYGREMGEIYAVAVEPRPPWRIAIAHELGGVRVVTDGDVHAEIRRNAPDGDIVATHLAWGANPNALYVRWDDGEFVRCRGDDLQTYEGFNQSDPIDALAADDRGVVALVAAVQSLNPYAGTFREGEAFELRELLMDVNASPFSVQVAVAGDSIAVTLDSLGAYVSRSPREPLARCASLENACAVAFEDASTGAPLYAAVSLSSTRSLVRVEASGATVRVVDIEAEGSQEPADVSALAWDASRRTLWAASKAVGLVACTAPGAKVLALLS